MYISGVPIISFISNKFPALQGIIESKYFLILEVVIILCHFLYWNKNNFYTTEIISNNSLVIECEDGNYLINIFKFFIVPSEHSLNVLITLKFDEYVRSDLSKKGCYTLIFKKPSNLEIKSINNSSKFNPIVIEEGIDKPFYCIKMDYKHTNDYELLFNLQADENINSELEIYFLIGDYSNEKDFNKLISNKKPHFSEEIIGT